MSNPSQTKTILFLGATGGVALSALRRSLAANHTCIALCRTPATLISKLAKPSSSSSSSSTTTTTTTTAGNPTLPPNLHITQGDAHDAAALARSLVVCPSDDDDHPSRARLLVDAVVFSIGARPTLRGMSDAHVCEKGMRALLAALRQCRDSELPSLRVASGGGGGGGGPGPGPRIVAVSSTGVSDAGRDVPLLMVPLYKVVLATAHRDKKAMEEALVASGEEWTLVRGSLYTDGPESRDAGRVRVGVEDVVNKVVESKAVGYTISREDLGKWIFENCIEERAGKDKYLRKAAMVTY